MMILSVQSLFRVLTRICLLVLDEINDILFYSILRIPVRVHFHVQHTLWKLSPVNIRTGSSLKFRGPCDFFNVCQRMSHAESHQVSLS
jgi:hypothetical protein